ncbi:MAG: hypothetical protein ACMUIE_02675 [Thermoplasmatota archaeon]
MTDDQQFPMGVEDDPDDPEYDIHVSVKCPHCPIVFQGMRESVEEELYLHIWKVHEDEALDFILTNMYISPELKERIFSEMGPEYVSWVVDTEGEIEE